MNAFQTPLRWLVLFAAGCTGALAQDPPLPTEALKRFKAVSPVQARIQLQLWTQETLKGRTTTDQASVSLEVDQDGSKLHTTWPLAVLDRANEEARRKDEGGEGGTPSREAIQELEPARIHHLLDQGRVLAGLLKGATFIKESQDRWEGRPARLLVYSFKPRLTRYEATYMRRSKGTFRLWTLADGTPLASESATDYEGKTSRFFGRIQSSVRVETRYQVVGDHLAVDRRLVENARSAEDGSELSSSKRTFTVDAK